MSAAIEPEVVEPQQLVPSEIAFPLSAENKRVFLDALLLSGGNITQAAKRVGISRVTVLNWRNSDAAFRAEFEAVLEHGTENLEEVAYKRAMSKSDLLTIFLLKARRPEKYRENIKVETELSDDAVDRITSGFIERLMELRTAQVTDGPDGPTTD